MIRPGRPPNRQRQNPPHIWENHFYPEVVVPETGEVLPAGERGELIFTSVIKEAMPVIRFRTNI